VTPGPRAHASTEVTTAGSRAEVHEVATLFREYADSLGIDLGFQGFETELATLPGEYAPPRGLLLLAYLGGRPVGCAGVRPFGPGTCELKRLYLRPAARRHGVGLRLVLRSLAFAEEAGYSAILLDTLPSMTAAIALYTSLGFVEVAPYRENPIPGARYFRRELSPRAHRTTSK
jgi:ribosomal protein S18 acetylase RimI-like enzyme